MPPPDGVAGSGCAPGAGPLPDGEWFGFVVSATDAAVDFDLACYNVCSTCDGGPGSWVGNDNDLLREVPVASATSVNVIHSPNATGSLVPFEDWRMQSDFPIQVWLYEVDPVWWTGWLCGDAVAVTVVQVLVLDG